MFQISALTVGVILDWIFGDPLRIPHPVVFIGRLIGSAEKRLCRPGTPGQLSLIHISEEKIIRCDLKDLERLAKEEGITKTALIVVGDAAAQTGYLRSRLYAPEFETEFRKASSGGDGDEKEQKTQQIGE